MNADLESARLSVYHAAWLSDTEGPTQPAIAALYRAKYLVGEATARIGRNAPDPGRRAYVVQGGTVGTAVPRWYGRGDSISAQRFLSVEPRGVSSGSRSA